MILRQTTINDVPTLRHWDKQAHVIAATGGGDWEWERELAQGTPGIENFIAEINGRPLGFIQICDAVNEQSHYWESYLQLNPEPHVNAVDIWIGDEKDFRKGYGTAMMQLAHDRCFSDGECSAILLDPLETNHRAHKFYESLGYQFIQHHTFDDDYCRVYRLDRKQWQNAN